MANEASDGSQPADDRSPFERFEALTRRIVSVPKSEIDAARKKQKKGRAKPRDRRVA